MSSINPVVVLPEALQVRGEIIASELAASVVLGCGQFCTNPGW
jgi:NADP-dependent aldehyde dehydrogenase